MGYSSESFIEQRDLAQLGEDSIIKKHYETVYLNRLTDISDSGRRNPSKDGHRKEATEGEARAKTKEQ